MAPAPLIADAPAAMLESAVRGLGKRLVVFDLLQSGLQGRPDSRDGIAARVKLLRRVRHAGDLDQGLAQLLRVALLRAVVGRPHVFGLCPRRRSLRWRCWAI